MLPYEAKIAAVSAAANMACETAAPPKAAVSAAVAYLCGKTDKTAFTKKCAKSPLFARLLTQTEQTECTAESFCALHKALFDPKAKCGELRGGELTLTGGSCTPPSLLRGSLKSALIKLGQTQGAPAASKSDFAAALCCYVRELIILSPFAYGNEITRRAFLQNFCYKRGFLLNYAAVNKKELKAAETEAFAADDPQPLFAVLVKMLSYRLETETAAARNSSGKRAVALREAPKQLQSGAKKPKTTAVNKKEAKQKATAQTLRQMQKTIDALSAQINEMLRAFPDDNEK